MLSKNIFYQKSDFLPFSKKIVIFLVKIDIKNGFSDLFPFQKCIFYIHCSYSLKVTALPIFQNFWVDTNLKLLYAA